MGAIPFSTIVLVIVVLLVVWLFLAHMILSRKGDARLRFLTSLMDESSPDAGRSDAATQRPAASVHETSAPKSLQGKAEEFAPHGDSGVAGFVSRELPVVFAAALRGRAM